MDNQQNNLLHECAEYFRRKKGFERSFMLIRQKMESFGKTSGKVILNNVSLEERLALQSFLAKNFKEDSISFSLKTFEEALSETKFTGITLKELIEEYFNESIVSNKDKKIKISKLKSEIRNNIQNNINRDFGTDNPLSIMIGEMSDKEFNTLVQTCYGKSYNTTKDNESKIINIVLKSISPIGKVFEILDNLGDSTVRLAVLAMKCTGDPHAFDRDRTEGKLLLKFLRNLDKDFYTEHKNHLSAEDILELYILHSIRPDDISSFTVLHGIRLYNGEESHPAYDSFIEKHEFYLTSLSNLSSITRAVPINKDVFVVENQMVFSQLCDACPNASIICTSGQIKTASLLVIDLLCKEDCNLYYNGDFDGEGLTIANRIIKRNSEKIHLWRISVEDYRKSVSSVELGEDRLKKLERIDNPELLETVKLISENKKAGYQEMLINDLIFDINNSTL